MTTNLLSYHLDCQGKNMSDTLGIIIFKPHFDSEEIENFRIFCNQNQVRIIQEKNSIFSRETVIALYPKIFCFSPEDIKYGVGWKQEIIEYLTSADSFCFFVERENISKLLSDYKYRLRAKYGKVNRPTRVFNSGEFAELVIKNLIHVVDLPELQNAIWLLFAPL